MKKMVINIIKNILLFIVSIFLIVTITFFLLEIIPGEIYDLDHIKNENIILNIKNKYNLDKPMLSRYKTTLINTAKLDFGNSFINDGISVRKIIFKFFPVSAKLGLLAIILSFVNGIYFGFGLFKIKNIKKKNIITFALVFFTSIPTFVLAIILQYVFTVKLNLFPVYGIENFTGYILPVIILSISPTIFISRTLEKKLSKISNEDYIVAAKARGIKTSDLYLYYLLKNSISPILSFVGPTIANLIVGSFVVESIFNIPGLGRYFITSITNRDYPLILGLTTFFSIILIGSTYFFNILVTLVDYKGDLYDEKK